jgi:SAM-dependent methyltransferase
VNPDILRWNEKYRATSSGGFATPDALLIEQRALLSDRGRALDVACGAGANGLFVAECGYRVVGVDASIEGLKIARRRARERGLEVDFVNVDLESYRPPPRAFDLLLVFRYLNRGLLPALEEALRPGGLMFYKTFNRNHLRGKPGFNPDYLLEPGELKRCFPGLDLVARKSSG